MEADTTAGESDKQIDEDYHESPSKRRKLNSGKGATSGEDPQTVNTTSTRLWQVSEINCILDCAKKQLKRQEQSKPAAQPLTLTQFAHDLANTMHVLCSGLDCPERGATVSIVSSLPPQYRQVWKEEKRNESTLLNKLRLLRHTKQYQDGELKEPTDAQLKAIEKCAEDFKAIDWDAVKLIIPLLDTTQDSEATSYLTVVRQPLEQREAKQKNVRERAQQREENLHKLNQQIEADNQTYSSILKQLNSLVKQSDKNLSDDFKECKTLLDSFPWDDKLKARYITLLQEQEVEPLHLYKLSVADLSAMGFKWGHAAQIKLKLEKYKAA